MDKSPLKTLTLTCVSAVIAGLIPATRAQESLPSIERAPENVFEKEQQEGLAKYFQTGPISVRPHLYADAYYDDNISLRRGAKQEDFVWRIAPGVLFGAGEFRGDKGTYVSLDYTLRGEIYSKYNEFNAVDHYVIASGGWKQGNVTLGLSQSYESDHGKSVEASAYLEQEIFLTLLTSKYDISEKTSVELNGRQSLASTIDDPKPGAETELPRINEWAAEAWGNYKFSEKISGGAGVTVGFRDITTFPPGNDTPDFVDSPNQTYEQLLVRGTYKVTEKVDAIGSAGIQFTQFQDDDDKSPTFVFSLGGSYRPLQNTFLSLEAYRRDIPSIVYPGRNYDLTGFRFAAKQILRDKYALSLSTGYEHSDYSNVSSLAGPDPDREDNYFWFRPTADYYINERWQMGLFYQYRTKSSSEDGYDFVNNQVGVYSNYRF